MAKTIEQTSIFRTEPMQQLELSNQHPIRAITKVVEQRAEVSLHLHPWGQLVFSDTGVVLVKTPNASYWVPPQHAVWIPPNKLHSASLLERAKLFSVYLFAQNRFSTGNCGLETWTECGCFEVSHLLAELVRTMAKGSPNEWDDATYASLCHLIVRDIQQSILLPVGVPMPTEKRLSHLCTLFLQAPQQQTSLVELAKQVGASESTIGRLFKRELHMTFSQWRQQALLARAIVLGAQKIPIGQIAQELGYASHSAFTAMVTSMVGKSPKQFLYR
ncbi:helix-turn-helix domain-containing protein [Vibrio navarrensis]